MSSEQTEDNGINSQFVLEVKEQLCAQIVSVLILHAHLTDLSTITRREGKLIGLEFNPPKFTEQYLHLWQ